MGLLLAHLESCGSNIFDKWASDLGRGRCVTKKKKTFFFQGDKLLIWSYKTNSWNCWFFLGCLYLYMADSTILMLNSTKTRLLPKNSVFSFLSFFFTFLVHFYCGTGMALPLNFKFAICKELMEEHCWTNKSRLGSGLLCYRRNQEKRKRLPTPVTE